jgi:hypothetical protein
MWDLGAGSQVKVPVGQVRTCALYVCMGGVGWDGVGGGGGVAADSWLWRVLPLFSRALLASPCSTALL